MKLIGVSGKKGTGKDTFFQMLESCSDVPVYRLAFADVLKDEVYEAILKPDGLSRSMLDDVNTKEQFRILLQWWGTEYRRRLFRDDYWLVALSKKIEQYQNEDAIVVITDIRFPNEFEYIKSLGGHMVRIARPDLNQSGDAHFSETALDNEENFDTFIDNNGSLEQFKAIVETYYASGEISTPKKIVSVAR